MHSKPLEIAARSFKKHTIGFRTKSGKFFSKLRTRRPGGGVRVLAKKLAKREAIAEVSKPKQVEIQKLVSRNMQQFNVKRSKTN